MNSIDFPVVVIPILLFLVSCSYYYVSISFVSPVSPGSSILIRINERVNGSDSDLNEKKKNETKRNERRLSKRVCVFLI